MVEQPPESAHAPRYRHALRQPRTDPRRAHDHFIDGFIEGCAKATDTPLDKTPDKTKTAGRRVISGR
jgi:hypothetical protein